MRLDNETAGKRDDCQGEMDGVMMLLLLLLLLRETRSALVAVWKIRRGGTGVSEIKVRNSVNAGF